MSGALEQLARELAREASDAKLRQQNETLEAELAARLVAVRRPRRSRAAASSRALWRVVRRLSARLTSGK